MKTLQRYSIVKYNDDFFPELFDSFEKFQKKVKIKNLFNTDNKKTFIKKRNYLLNELKKIINNTKYNFLAINNDTADIFGFVSFHVLEEQCWIYFIFKSEDYKMNKNMFNACEDSFNIMRKLGYTNLYGKLDRNKEKQYLKFLNKFFNIEILSKNPTTFIIKP
jgi:hypothetical protein